MSRHLIIVDTETTGLDLDTHWVLEVAAINVTTREEMYFVPALPERALGTADGKALKINGYFSRAVYAHRLDRDAADKYWRQLWDWLAGNTLAGSNPTFDAAMLNKAALWSTQQSAYNGPKQLVASPWHHRLADLSAYAAGALGIDPTHLPGLDAVCERLSIENESPHSAIGDARATMDCFVALAERHYTGKAVTNA